MNFMTCTTCNRVVQVNCTGVCLSCQRGFMNQASEDALMTEEMKVEALQNRLKEIEDALQKPEAKSVDVYEPAKDGKRVGSGNPKRKKASKKGKAKR